jgi:hypothetical protein
MAQAPDAASVSVKLMYNGSYDHLRTVIEKDLESRGELTRLIDEVATFLDNPNSRTRQDVEAGKQRGLVLSTARQELSQGRRGLADGLGVAVRASVARNKGEIETEVRKVTDITAVKVERMES